MAIKGLSLAEKEQYILKDDPGNPEHSEHKAAVKKGEQPERPTVFFIGNLSAADRVEIGDITMTPTMSNSGVSMSMQRMKRVYLTVQRGLKGWENFLDEKGNAIPFETETGKDGGGRFREIVQHECMLRLSSEAIFELAEAILVKNGMTKELAKNSEAASPLDLGQLLMGGAATTAQTSNSENEGAE